MMNITEFNFFSPPISMPPSMRQYSATNKKILTKPIMEVNSTSEQSLHQLLQQKELQIDNLQRKYLQIRQNKSKQPVGQNFMQGFLDDLLNDLKDKVDQKIINELINYTKAMNQMYRVQQSHLNLCAQRLFQSEQLLEQCKSQDINIKRTVQQLQESIQQAFVEELDSTKLYRDYQKLTLQYSKLKVQYDSLQKQNYHTEKNMQSFKQHLTHINEEAQFYKKTLRKEVSQNQTNQKRVFTLEQRLDVLSGIDYKKDKDTLRNIIDDMLKENEANKRKAFQKQQENEKLEQTISELKDKLAQLSKKNTIQEKQLKSLGYTAQDIYGKQVYDLEVEEKINIFQQNKIPNNLEFKYDSYNLKLRNNIQELLNFGVKATYEKLVQNEQQTEQILMYMDLFIQYKYLSESINNIIIFILDLMRQESSELIMIKIVQNSSLFECEKATLWLIDQNTATFFTINERNEQTNAYIDQDEFLNVVKYIVPIYAQQKFVYRTETNAKFAKDCYIIPILNQSRLIGLFLIENLNSRKQDSKYLGIVMANLLIPLLEKQSQIKIMNYQLKYKDIVFQAFQDLVKQGSHIKLQNCIQDYSERLFGVATSQFYFIEQDQLIKYLDEDKVQRFSTQFGIAGLVATQKEDLLLGSIKQHHAFYDQVDLNTSLPVFTLYLKVGVLQIILNQSLNLKDKTIDLKTVLKPNENLQSMAKMFGQIIDMAFQVIKF